MAEIIYANDLEITEPVLIDAASLEQLDQIIGRYFTIFESEYEQAASKIQQEYRSQIKELETKEDKPDNDFAKQLRNSNLASIESIRDMKLIRIYKPHKKITVWFERDNKAVAKSFAELTRDRSIDDDTPAAFRLQMSRDDFHCEIKSTSSYSNKVSISVGPERSELARELFVDLRRWANSVSAPSWTRYWAEADQAKAQWWLGIIIILIVASPWLFATNPAKLDLQQQARMLVDNGINSSNLNDAVALLLRLQLEYYPGSTNTPSVFVPTWVIGLTAVVVLGMVVLSIRPKFEIGLGKGIKNIDRWRWWIKFVGYAIPGFVVTSFIIPWLVQLLTSIFSGSFP
jgi:hypothetical protein